MRCKARVNPAKDMNYVDQFGFVNLNEAIATGNVSGAVNAGEAQFDSSANFSPKAVLGKARDFFEACEASDTIKAAAEAAEAKAAAAAAAAAAAGATS